MDTTTARLASRGGPLHWLVESGPGVPPAIRPQLLAQLLSSPAAIVMGALTGLIVAGVCFGRADTPVFAVLGALEVALLGLRLAALRKIRRHQAFGLEPTIDLPITLSILWCSLQGLTAFFAMQTGDAVLMVLSATMVMAVIGPLCSRNYAAPRLAFLLVCLCDLPFVAGALATGEPWFAVILVMTPFFLLGAMQITLTYHAAMVRALTAELTNLENARHDPLTGLLNRAGLNASLERVKDADPLAIVAMDLDGFKEINDRYGHAAGDAILEQVAQRMQAVMRECDMLARLGGDEFLAVLLNLPTGKVEMVAQRLLRTIHDESYAIPGGPDVHVGISIGYACLPEDTRSIPTLREYADSALYAAKDAGKGLTTRFANRRAA